MDLAAQFQSAWEHTHATLNYLRELLSNPDYMNGKINDMRKAVIHINTVH